MTTDITTESRQIVNKSQKSELVIEPNKAVDRQNVTAIADRLPTATRESSQESKTQFYQAADKLNQQVQNIRRDLQFTVDDESGDVIIKVIESNSQRLIRTIPSDEFISMSERFNQGLGALVNAKA